MLEKEFLKAEFIDLPDRASTRGMSPFLHPEFGREWFLEGEWMDGEEIQKFLVEIDTSPFLVGRKLTNNFRVLHQTVSGTHAEFILDNGRLWLRDLGSTNGTYLNGIRVELQVEVNDGEMVQFGKVRFSLKCKQHPSSDYTEAFDASDEALSYVLFAKLWDGFSFKPHFQPVVRFSDHHLAGFEALARSELLGLETPRAMFKIAKQCKAEAELAVLSRQVSLRLSQSALADQEIYLNTHPREMGSKDLLYSLEQLREEFPSARVVIEVHEESVGSIDYLKELKRVVVDLGMKLAYDDFGRGQSRLKELDEVTPHIVKFDIELVQGLHKATMKRKQLIQSFLEIVKTFGVITLAEGVEDAGDAAACQEIGFDFAQGYFFGRPAPLQHWIHPSETHLP